MRSLEGLLRPSVRRDPLPYLESLRAVAPAHFNEHLGVWLVVGADAATELLSYAPLGSPRTMELIAATGSTEQQSIAKHVSRWLPFQDGAPLHALRTLVARVLGEADVASLSRHAAGALIDGLEQASHQEVDVAGHASAAFDVLVMDLLGVPQARRVCLRSWSDTMGSALEPFALRVRSQRRMDTVVDEASPVVTALVNGTERWDSDGLIDRMLQSDLATSAREDVAANALFLVGAAHDTLSAACTSLIASCADPRFRSLLHAAPSRAVDEVLLDAPPVQLLSRSVDRSWAGATCSVEAGQSVVVSLASVNADLARPNPREWTFGRGAHRCPGAFLARSVLDGIATEMAERPDITSLSIHSQRWSRSLLFRGRDELTVRSMGS